MDDTEHIPPADFDTVLRPRSMSETDSELGISSPDAGQRTPPARSLSQTLASYNLPSYNPPSYISGTSAAAAAAAQAASDLPPILTVGGGGDGGGGRPRQDTLPSISTVTGSTMSSTTGDSRMSSPLTAATEMSFSPNLQPLQVMTLPPSNPWPSLNPLTAYYTPGHVQQQQQQQQIADPPPLHMDVDASSTASASGRAASVSIDDPDVRLAAEALGDLRADFVSSPPHRTSMRHNGSSSRSSSTSKSEPLLSLLTTSHPLLAKTIENTTSAYNSSKNFSPRFKSGAEYVEGYLTPLGHTLGSVSRVTGVEGGVRWFLGGGRRPRQQQQRRGLSAEDAASVSGSGSDASGLASFYKRRKVGRRGRSIGSIVGSPEAVQTPDASSEHGAGSAAEAVGDGGSGSAREERQHSMSTDDTLPAYDDMRSPAYTESVDGSVRADEAAAFSTAEQQKQQKQQQQQQQRQLSSPPPAWQSRLIMSTSGLSIAMSDESLRSLKYCLNWLRWANGHIDKVITALKTAVDQYDAAHPEAAGEAGNMDSEDGEDSTSKKKADDDTARTAASSETDRNELAARIVTLRGDVLQTLKGVVDTVSKYAGGALPDNARVLVRRHLTSLPQRFRLASLEVGSRSGGGGGGGGGGGSGEDADDVFSSLSASSAGGTPASDKEVREGAQRVLVLAREGLDMMSQVSGVLDGTIVSAEEWCERLGKRKNSGVGAVAGTALEAAATAGEMATATATAATATVATADGDVEMQ